MHNTHIRSCVETQNINWFGNANVRGLDLNLIQFASS